MPGPPALVRMATRSPAGRGWLESSVVTSKSSLIVAARITPAWRKRASTVASDADTMAPVCEPAARAPARPRALLTATMGVVRDSRRATRAKVRGLPNDSR